MNIFVTVGTTPFRSLISILDEIALNDNLNNYIFQTSDPKTTTLNGYSFQFTDNITHYYNSADLVITHAGAGTIYQLLELKKKIIVVPNLERIDKHQSDISSYMELRGHLLVCWNISELAEKIGLASDFNPVPYVKDEFFKNEEIIRFIRG